MPETKKHTIESVDGYLLFQWKCRRCGKPNADGTPSHGGRRTFTCLHCCDRFKLDLKIAQFAYDYRHL